jgi:hypothetical protein
MPKMTPPASPDDASSNRDTKIWNYIGINIAHLSKGLILYAKNDATSITR